MHIKYSAILLFLQSQDPYDIMYDVTTTQMMSQPPNNPI